MPYTKDNPKRSNTPSPQATKKKYYANIIPDNMRAFSTTHGFLYE